MKVRFIMWAAASVCLYSCGHKSDTDGDSSRVVRVETMTVGSEASSSVMNGRTYSGTVEGGKDAVLSFSVPGTIKDMRVDAGDRVSAGQVLARLDAQTLQNNLDIARTTLAQAEDAYTRMKKLHDAGALADIKWVDVQSKLEQARSAERIAQRALDDAVIHSPMTGVVSERYVEQGATVAPTLPLLKVIETSRVDACISVSESEIGNIGNQTNAVVTCQGQTYNARLDSKGVSADPLTRTYRVKFEIDNSKGTLLPGMICDVRLEGASPTADTTIATSTIVLPVGVVLLSSDNKRFVWIDSAGVAVRRVIEADELTPDGITVTKGLNPGDRVIVRGMQKVSSGMNVCDINEAHNTDN